MRLRRHRTIHFKEVAELPPDDEEMRLFDMELDIYAVLEALEGRLTGRNLDDTLVGDGLSFTEQTLTTPKQLQLDSSYSPTFADLTADSLTVGDWTVELDATNDFKLEFNYQGSTTVFQLWDDQVVFNASLTREAGTQPNIGTLALPFGTIYADDLEAGDLYLSTDARLRRVATGVTQFEDNASNLGDARLRRVGDADGDTYMDSGEGGDTDQLTFVAAGTAAFRVEDGAVDYLYSLTAADSTTPTHINLPTGGTAAQAGWLTVKVNGTTSYLPVWQ